MRDARRSRLRLFVYFLAAMAWIADGIQLAACKTLGMPGHAKKKVALLPGTDNNWYTLTFWNQCAAYRCVQRCRRDRCAQPTGAEECCS